jgi:hypothetical protein
VFINTTNCIYSFVNIYYLGLTDIRKEIKYYFKQDEQTNSLFMFDAHENCGLDFGKTKYLKCYVL